MRTRLLVGGVVIVTTVASLAVYKAIEVHSLAGKNLQATVLVTDLVRTFVRENDGEWPSSWDDLRSIHANSLSRYYRWPEDEGEIRKRVWVDFNATSQRVLTDGIDDFTEIRPIGPSYSYDHHIELLFEELARQREE